ncbi:MAG TPA: hypothetical protein VN820_02090 [Acidimicrobiales bacterium]|nr:hypothetical protein [Acidimicrobiales bacterium]
MPYFAEESTTELERRIGPLKAVSVVETFTYVALLGFWLSGNRVGTLMLGSMHGLVVCGFAGMVLLIFRPLGWSLRFALLTILTGPIGAMILFVRLRREEPEIHAREQAKVRERQERRAGRSVGAP